MKTLICQNDLIDSVKKYTPIELKIFYNLLYCYKEIMIFKIADYQTPDSDDINFYIVDAKKMIGDKHLSFTEIINIIENMPNKIFINNRQGFVSVFEFLQYDEEQQSFKFNLTESFKPFVEDIMTNFTVLRLEQLASLTSKYALRMFELASKNLKMGNFIFKTEDFYNYFSIPASYTMNDITKRVLIAMDEINTKTDIKIKCEKIKRSNKVTHFKFYFTDNNIEDNSK